MINSTKGPARETLSRETAEKLESAKTLVHDDRRVRSFFFDGRFLTAKDLTREQTYFLTRQADLSRAGGTGVVAGLEVAASSDLRTLTLRAGHGLTPGGEMVVVPQTVGGIRLDDIPEIQRLDAAFGVSRVPAETPRNRTGLYLLALRPVEFTANPIASYPTTVGGARTAHDGDIIEAAALTLIPYPDAGANGGTFETRRSKIVQEVFAGTGLRAATVDALALAMVALDRGQLRWVDMNLVRREVGNEQASFVGFGVSPRALREAHVNQYDQHLQDVLKARRSSGQQDRFLASEHFFTLPPAGRMPTAAIDAASLTEFFFPPEMDVELTIVAEDELGAIIDESLQLPPIDLTQTGESLESVGILIMVPVPRNSMSKRMARLSPVFRNGPLKLRAATVGSIARRLPGDALQELTKRWEVQPVTSTVTSLVDSTWAEVLTSSKLIWFTRRRNLPTRFKSLAQAVMEPDDVDGDQATTIQWLREAGLYDEFSSLPTRATAVAIGEIFTQLIFYRSGNYRWEFAGFASDILRLGQIQHQELSFIRGRYTPNARSGLQRLTAHATLGTISMEILAGSTRMPEIGTYVQPLSTTAFNTFATNFANLILVNKLRVDDAFRNLVGGTP